MLIGLSRCWLVLVSWIHSPSFKLSFIFPLFRSKFVGTENKDCCADLVVQMSCLSAWWNQGTGFLCSCKSCNCFSGWEGSRERASWLVVAQELLWNSLQISSAAEGRREFRDIQKKKSYSSCLWKKKTHKHMNTNKFQNFSQKSVNYG